MILKSHSNSYVHPAMSQKLFATLKLHLEWKIRKRLKIKMRLHNNCLNLIVDGVVGHVAMCDHALYRKVMKYGWIAMSCRKLGTIFWDTDYRRPMKSFSTISQTFGTIGRIGQINFGVFGVVLTVLSFLAQWVPSSWFSSISFFFLQKKLLFRTNPNM